jgi:hypothetical protein
LSTALRDVVRYAIMTASSHNTPPWKLSLGEHSITVLPDPLRRTPAVDPDDHHLFISLGCATENLVHAALASGLHIEITPRTDRADVALGATRAVRSPLFEAIPLRQCSRSEYDEHALSATELRVLEQAGSGSGVEIVVLTDKPRIETVLEYVACGNETLLTDKACLAELSDWIRFNDADAVRTRDGLLSRSTGNPRVPRWLGRGLLPLLVTAKSVNEKAAAQLRSAAGGAVYVSQADDRTH